MKEVVDYLRCGLHMSPKFCFAHESLGARNMVKIRIYIWQFLFHCRQLDLYKAQLHGTMCRPGPAWPGLARPGVAKPGRAITMLYRQDGMTDCEPGLNGAGPNRRT